MEILEVAKAQPYATDHTNLAGRLFPPGAFDASMRVAQLPTTGMLIQVTKIENGYVLGISDKGGSLLRLIYASDLTDVGQQITAFAVARELEGKGAKT